MMEAAYETVMRLTNKTVEALKPLKTPYEARDSDVKGFLARVQPTGLITYYFDYRDYTGKRQRIRLGTHGTISPAGARDAAIKHAAEVALGRNVQADKKQAKAESERAKHNTLGAFLKERYQPWVEAERKSGKATVKRLQKYFDHLSDVQLSAIDYWSIEKWRAERRKSKIKPATINRDVGALKALLSKAVEWGIIEHHPLQRLKPIRFDDRAKVRFLSKSEEDNLRTALLNRSSTQKSARASANEWRGARGYPLLRETATDEFFDYLAPMVLLSLNTGLRRGELFKLTWRNVSLSRCMLTVEGNDAKNGKTRHIPLNSEAHSVLTKWRKQSTSDTGLVFPNSVGVRFDNVNTAWERLLKSAGISDFRWHDMRHHFASKLVMASVDLNTVRELLGHSDITMTLRYAHLAPEHKANAVERLVEAA